MLSCWHELLEHELRSVWVQPCKGGAAGGPFQRLIQKKKLSSNEVFNLRPVIDEQQQKKTALGQ